MISAFSGLAQGCAGRIIDLNSLFIKHPTSTLFMTVDSDSYVRLGIFRGDLLIIDRSKRINQNSLVVYESEGQIVMGRVFNIKSEAIITGCITYVIHRVKEK